MDRFGPGYAPHTHIPTILSRFVLTGLSGAYRITIQEIIYSQYIHPTSLITSFSMHFARLALMSALAAIGQAALIRIRQDDSDSSVGKPVSVGLAANRSTTALNTFGTTNQSVNFLTMPTTLCVVPMFASEAGMKNTTDLLITQQALEICPQAKSIVVSEINSTVTA
ncbi:hypothetical protein V565_057320 [Rhizoctonia solani 123E]|uniref:Uncharacterized protein n=1 Tax=Rhizoctonia solani 123E TaxID=1423351 RepID=A0A074SNU6_9AGAM|nr:hypothetical protein V565_057320 [Rhizoctonia solani 123E]